MQASHSDGPPYNAEIVFFSCSPCYKYILHTWSIVDQIPHKLQSLGQKRRKMTHCTMFNDGIIDLFYVCSVSWTMHHCHKLQWADLIHDPRWCLYMQDLMEQFLHMCKVAMFLNVSKIKNTPNTSTILDLCRDDMFMVLKCFRVIYDDFRTSDFMSPFFLFF